MSDTSGHVAPQPDELHTITLSELETRVAEAGVLISRRQLMRHCESGTFDAKKLPAINNIKEWFITPASIEKGIADIKTLQEQRSRRAASRRDASGHDNVQESIDDNNDMSGHVASDPDTTAAQNMDTIPPTQSVTTRHDATDIDIYNHPYVQKLEERVEKAEAKYEAQVRRTEEIQQNNQKQLLELQRMIAIGQSQTLADFMLKAKDFILGTAPDAVRKDADPQHNT